MNYRLLCLLLNILVTLNGFGQTKNWFEESNNEELTFKHVFYPTDNPLHFNQIKNYLDSELTLNGYKDLKVKLVHSIYSPVGMHYQFVLQNQGYTILGTSFKINLHFSGKPLLSFQNLPPKDIIYSSVQSTDVPTSSNIEFLKVNTSEFVWMIKNGKGVLCNSLIGKSLDGKKTIQRVINHQQQELFTKDWTQHLKKDTLVKGYIFNPDPVTSAGTTYKYKGNFRDRNDSTNSSLDSQRFNVSIIAIKDTQSILVGGSVEVRNRFFLNSKWVQFKDLGAPHIEVTSSDSPTFYFNRSQAGFECFNSYYHINTQQQHINDLGVTSLGKYPIVVDAHCGYDDNSSFLPSSDSFDNELQLGIGNVDDGEDADVIIHEYHHGMSFFASPWTVNGFERNAFEEGMCDYFACSYSKKINNYYSWALYNWDGHNEFWPGRSCLTNKLYPGACDNGDKYLCGEIWAGSLMEIWNQLGRDTTDLLALTTMFSYANNQKMPQLARIFLQNDSVLFNYKHKKIITDVFVAHKLLQNNGQPVGIKEDEGTNSSSLNNAYFNSLGLLNLHFDQPESGIWNLINLNGQLIYSQTFSNQINLNYFNPALSTGIYLIRLINTKGHVSTFKVIKS